MPPHRARRLTVDGNHILYHFLQKTLLESDAEQFRQLASQLIAALGIWLSPDIYRRYPLLVPYAVRDPTCRGDRLKGIPDEWGAPDNAGLIRDDNSLIKNLPRSLLIANSSNRLLDKRYIGRNFVAAHVWRRLNSGAQAARERVTYSFVPNLVWLPSQVSKLSDREESFVQTYLQALSWRIYRDFELCPKLKDLVEPVWKQLSLRSEAHGLELPDPSTLNYFCFEPEWIGRRLKSLRNVIRALEDVSDGGQPRQKTVSTRYMKRLPTVSKESVTQLLSELRIYSKAVEGGSICP